MKLTKGKISRLYNKKRQSVKKIKRNKKVSPKSKTFRRKRHINLANRSLKKYRYKKGGAEGEDEMPKEVEPVAEVPVSVEQPVEAPVVAEEPVVEEMPEVVEQPAVVEPVAAEMPIEEVPAPVEPVAAEMPIEEVPAPVEPVAELPVEPVEEMPVEEMPVEEVPVEEVPVEPVAEQPADVEPVDAAPIEEVPAAPIEEVPVESPVSAAEMFAEDVDSAPLVDLTTSNENPELVESLAKVVDYISDKVADKVASQVGNKLDSSEIVETTQDGFDAVNNAANVMASNMSGGNAKKRKNKRTRKFRLVKKNKSKRA